MGCPIRESPDQRLLTATRGLSQLATPFIASWRQGIHHVPFLNLTANLCASTQEEVLQSLIYFSRCEWIALLVEMTGLEPAPSSLRTRRSPG